MEGFPPLNPRGKGIMSRRSEIENLVNVKKRLAEKTESLARARHSKPAKEKLRRLAAKFRRQQADFERML